MIVFVFIVSPRGEKSLGYRFICLLEKELKEKCESLEMKIYRADQVQIKEVDGTANDFIKGHSLYDDDMEEIENEMLESDIIILVSPVYAHNVSSQTKKFIDRLSYWLHIYRLIGKMGVVVSTSSDNGNENVNAYLTEMLEYMGLYVIGDVSIQSERLVKQKGILESYAQIWAKRILLAEATEFPNRQEENFQAQKKKFENLKFLTEEKKYWVKNGYFNVRSFKELYDLNRKDYE